MYETCGCQNNNPDTKSDSTILVPAIVSAPGARRSLAEISPPRVREFLLREAGDTTLAAGTKRLAPAYLVWGRPRPSKMRSRARSMKGHPSADEWTRGRVWNLSERHFPGRAKELEEILGELAKRHETEWRSTSAGVFRPTASMYALALSWELEKLGPTCTFCEGSLEVPKKPPGSSPSGLTVTLRPRLSPRNGGLNVPQNLALGHADCYSKL